MKPSLRLKLLIYPRFQVTLIAVNIATILLAFGFVAFEIERTFARLRALGLASGLPPAHAYFRFLTFQSDSLLAHLAYALAGAVAASLLVTLVLSHRLAGPLVRLKSYFRSIAEGNEVRPLTFRKNDFLSDLPPVVNQAFDRSRK